MEHVNNNLSLCLAAIAGKVDPNIVKYHNGLEYQLLKIAGMTEESGGGSDDTPSGEKYTAKKVTTYVQNQEMGRAAYMVTVDLGIDSIPYDVFDIEADIDGQIMKSKTVIESDHMASKAIQFEGDTINFTQSDIDNSYVLAGMSIIISSVRAFFIQEGGELRPGQSDPIRLQMFIYPGTAEEEPPAEKEMTINVTLVEDTGK